MARIAEIETEDVFLSFAPRAAGVVVCYWSPVRSGKWDVDCRTGRKAAIELARAVRTSENPGLLHLVISALYSNGDLQEAVEIAFLSTIGELMCRGANA